MEEPNPQTEGALKKKLKYWLAFGRLKGVGKASLKGIFESFAGPEEVFAAADGGRGGRKKPCEALAPISEELCAGIKAFDAWDWVDNELSLIEKAGARVVAFTDPEYPRLLREINDPPVLLYAKGALTDFERPSVAVVGTRHPSHYGLKMSEVVARDLAYSGVTVVSGMARGCDSAAHKGALSANGFTVVVLGTGVDVPYPVENVKLYGRILEAGAIVSELPMATPPAPYNFPKRNRIISGFSMGVIVVEAPLRSGALQTARLALDYNRDVFAVPGAVTSPKSMGTNRLIKEGAMLLESAADALGALNITAETRAALGAEPPVLSSDERVVWDSLNDAPVHIDAVIAATGLPAHAASAVLLDMELRGLVVQTPGMCFLRRV